MRTPEEIQETLSSQYFDAAHGIKLYYRDLEVSRMSYGMSPHREIIKYNIRRVTAWDEIATLFIKDVKDIEHEIGFIRFQQIVEEEKRIQILREQVLFWLDKIVYGGRLMDFIIKEPIERRLIPEMFEHA